MKVLITGGNGFLGTNLGLKLSNDGFEVLLASRNNKANFIAARNTKCIVAPLDITNLNSVDDTICIYKPDIVIHAAATKFIDLSEIYPNETIDVNILGSQNIARSCIKNKVKYLIGISTDKAAPPVRNTYGLSKALMERLFLGLANTSDTIISCLRYGNVAWSTGSVLVEWKRQAEQNNKIITCGPEMYRYLFTVQNACELVYRAIKNIDIINGKLLTLDMKAVKIRRLLEVFCRINNCSYEEVNPRQGERDTEFLVGETELPHASTINLDKKIHYLIDFTKNLKSSELEIQHPISAKTSTQMNENDIENIIKSGY